MPPLVPIASGAACEIFDLGDGRVLKAFFNIVLESAPRADPSWAGRISCAAELQAYRRLQDYRSLERYVPRFFGAVDPNAYQLASERTFPSGCGLILERIPGKDVKLFKLPAEVLGRVEDVLDQVKDQIGVDDPWDGSCFVPGTRADFTVIDFATPTEKLVELDGILKKHGTVPSHMWRAFGLD